MDGKFLTVYEAAVARKNLLDKIVTRQNQAFCLVLAIWSVVKA
jgi:hypothetical protein